MWWIRKDERLKQQASGLFNDAVALHARGQSGEAARRLTEAIGLSRRLAAQHPEDPIHNQATASAFQRHGNLLLAAGDRKAGEAALAAAARVA